MKALRVHRFGDELQFDADVSEPESADGELVVEVRYVAVNPLDIWVTRGTVGGSQALPFIPGTEGVGRVAGRMVLIHGGGVGVRRDGLYAERAAVPADAVLDLPEGIDPVQAATLPVAGRTAWRLSHDFGRVEPGQTLVVLGASGGVGSLVIQLAKHEGARVVAHTGSADKAGWLDELGADEVIVGSAAEIAPRLRELAPEVVLDPLGGDYTAAGLAALAPHGRLVLFGTSACPTGTIDLRELYRKAATLTSYAGIIEPAAEARAAVARVLAEVVAGRLRVPIEDTLPLERGAEAHHRILERTVRGKLVLQCGV
ncbi:MAG: zinc-binding dehydrogenase [Candidatus Dormibacteria bacterium]